MAISKYNPEGYFDPTPHEALTNIEMEHRAARLADVVRSPNYRPIVFICSPYADDPVGNERRALRYCRFAVCRGCIPIAPHLYFTRFLDETNPQDRELGLFMGRVLLTKCVAVSYTHLDVYKRQSWAIAPLSTRWPKPTDSCFLSTSARTAMPASLPAD